MLKIDGQAVKTPSKFTVCVSPLTSSAERNVLGETVMDFIGVKRTLKMRWAHIAPSELDALYSLVEGGFVSVQYPDADGTTCTMSAYAGERSAGILQMRGGAPVWTDGEMELIER